ncbi:MAG TPA: DMT family transporter [Solirubrobacteraceae bacterium]|jgi:transporter family-2 protein|nr:DMT family transporter [Solirubrobacteraceae bacterium]
MTRTLAVVLAAVAGVLVGMQAPVNSRLGREIGSVQAASFSFVVGTVALVLVALLFYGGLGSFSSVGKAPTWALVGGLLGAVYVTVAILTVRTLGVSGLTAIVISGQLAAAVVIDRFGLLGVAKQSIPPVRIVGLVLLVVGVLLVVRR